MQIHRASLFRQRAFLYRAQFSLLQPLLFQRKGRRDALLSPYYFFHFPRLFINLVSAAPTFSLSLFLSFRYIEIGKRDFAELLPRELAHL